MIQRPESLGEQFASRFQHQSVVDRYHLRPTYPPETFAMLVDLIVDQPRVVLDVGCGPGNIARPLAAYVERVDAVDWSLPMLERARLLPGGDSAKIHWLQGRAEEVEVQPPYALITAGESLHWMDWGVVLPRFARLLTANGVLAVVYVMYQPVPWRADEQHIVQRFTTNPTYVPIDMFALFEQHRLCQKLGEQSTAPVPVQQTIGDYIAGQHARSNLSLETMTAERAEEFDTEMRTLLTPFAEDGLLTFNVGGGMTVGKPLSGES